MGAQEIQCYHGPISPNIELRCTLKPYLGDDDNDDDDDKSICYSVIRDAFT